MILLAHEHRVRFYFVVDLQLTRDIHDHPLDRAGERPGILTRKVTCDWFATVSPHVQPLASNRELAWLGHHLHFAHFFVVDVDRQRAIGDMWWVLAFLVEDG